jgi:hypothetical protein
VNGVRGLHRGPAPQAIAALTARIERLETRLATLDQRAGQGLRARVENRKDGLRIAPCARLNEKRAGVSI